MSPSRGRDHSSSQDSEMTITSPENDLRLIASHQSSPENYAPITTIVSRGLPPGCTYGVLPPGTIAGSASSKAGERVIWVDFPLDSPENPFFFTKARKRLIVVVAVFYTFVTALNTAAWSISAGTLEAELGLDHTQVAAGLALYAWGFGIAPLVLAPLSEEFGRRWTYIAACFIYWQCHLFCTLGKNLATLLVGRFIQGMAGSIGATLVGGTISDMFVPEERGLPMAVFGMMAMLGTGLGPVALSWVEAKPTLGWRWIQWIQYILVGVYMVVVFFVIRETRATVILRRRAAAYRKQFGEDIIKGRFMARSEVEKVKFSVAMRQSLLRPLTFLIYEPIVTFFSIWVSMGWGVFYAQIAGIPYVFLNVYNFSITSIGLTYMTIVIGSFLGFIANFGTEAFYARKVAHKGVEARLYGPMVAGVALAVGCIMFAFTSSVHVHWIVPCIALVIVITAILTIYISCFTYLSECYGSYASSAIAAQSFMRNMVGGAFSLFTQDMYQNLTPRWASFIFGCIAGLLAIVPFVAFWKGPYIRSKSKYSKLLMAEERKRIEEEQEGRGRVQRDSEKAREGGAAGV